MKATSQRHRKLSVFFLVMVSVCLMATAGLFMLNRWRVELTIDGPEEQTLEYGSSFSPPPASALLKGDFILRSGRPLQITQTGSVNTKQLGDYCLHYTAKGLFYTAERSVTVHVVDTTPPVLTLVADSLESLSPGEDYQEAGYTAWDDADGDLTSQVQREIRKGGIYYHVTDRSGNSADAFRPISYFDAVPPELTLSGEVSATLQVGESFTEPGYSATDNVDGDITDRVTVSGSVDIWHAGSYTLHYSVMDSFGNLAEAERTVTVAAAPQPNPVTPNGKVIYLTFDDGPSQHTERLLKILDKYNVKATFFVVNYGHQEMIAKEAAAGHTVAIHSYSHDYNKIYASEEAFFSDLDAMNEIIRAQTGSYSTMLRFPGGSSNAVSNFNPGIMTRLTQAVTEKGYQYFDWNVSSGDAGLTTDTNVVYQNVIDGVKNYNSSIVLQHDSKGYSVDAVERIIQWGLDNGYSFLPLTPSSPTAHHKIFN